MNIWNWKPTRTYYLWPRSVFSTTVSRYNSGLVAKPYVIKTHQPKLEYYITHTIDLHVFVATIGARIWNLCENGANNFQNVMVLKSIFEAYLPGEALTNYHILRQHQIRSYSSHFPSRALFFPSFFLYVQSGTERRGRENKSFIYCLGNDKQQILSILRKSHWTPHSETVLITMNNGPNYKMNKTNEWAALVIFMYAMEHNIIIHYES